MPHVGIVFGLALSAFSGLVMVLAPEKMPIQFLPMMLGIPIFYCGVVGLNPHRCRFSMNSALAIGFSGFVLGLGRTIFTSLRVSRGEPINAYVFKVVIGLAVICALFLMAWYIAYRVRQKKKNGVNGRNLPAVDAGSIDTD